MLADIAARRRGDHARRSPSSRPRTRSCCAARVPVFVDIRPDTLNLDETLIEAAITPRTRAIVPVHYAGVGCEMDAIVRRSRARRGLLVIEDAAQGVMASYAGAAARRDRRISATSASTRPRTSSPAKAARCWSTTRAASSAPRSSARRAPTARSFFRGEVDKYTWVDIGSSFLPGEIIAAFLWAQLEEARGASPRGASQLWNRYHARSQAHRARGSAPAAGRARRTAGTTPTCTTSCCRERRARTRLHRAPRGARRQRGLPLRAAAFLARRTALRPRRRRRMPNTDQLSSRLLRLPLWLGLGDDVVDTIAAEIQAL